MKTIVQARNHGRKPKAVDIDEPSEPILVVPVKHPAKTIRVSNIVPSIIYQFIRAKPWSRGLGSFLSSGKSFVFR